MATCFKKLRSLFKKSRKGNVKVILKTFKIYSEIKQVERHFDIEIRRLSKLIRIKTKTTTAIQYKASSSQSYALSVTNPIAAALYCLINKFDHLMCVCETCFTLLIFKKSWLLLNKTNKYKQALLRVVNVILHYRIDYQALPINLIKNQSLIQQDKQILNLAINSDVMPIFNKKVLRKLKQITSK